MGSRACGTAYPLSPESILLVFLLIKEFPALGPGTGQPRWRHFPASLAATGRPMTSSG